MSSRRRRVTTAANYPPPENTRQVTAKQLKRPPMSYINFLCKNLSKVHTPKNEFGARMVTAGISHYAEKVRWGFDILRTDKATGFDYNEDAHTPGLAALWTTELDPQCSATPIVRYNTSNKVLKDSTANLRFTCPFLYPQEYDREIGEWEDMLDRELGPTVRVYAYEHFLKPPMLPVLTEIATAQTSWIEKQLWTILARREFIQPGMKRFMGISAETAERSKEDIHRIFDKVERAIERNPTRSGFIVGDRFTAVDLTFAALVSPIVQPDAFADINPKLSRMPKELQESVPVFRDTIAGQHAAACYTNYRFATLDSNKVVPRVLPGKRIRFRSGPRNNLVNIALVGASVGSVSLASALLVAIPALKVLM